ncbi:ANTAR domain-containing protein [Streptomyces phaeochromogenes]|uniref:ANTAR domain-containing protein n=1 Tax=Streptomyces phaeochromogenes TaxID=1923 RepID=UPI0036A61BFF
MQRTTMLPENWWDLRAEAAAGTAAAQDVVALRAEIEQLQRALAGRAVIDQACGMVMVLAPCRREPARNLLMDMARQCNTKLPDVAAAVVAAWEGEPLSRLMQRALRDALRRLYAEDRGCDSRLTGEPSGRGGP